MDKIKHRTCLTKKTQQKHILYFQNIRYLNVKFLLIKRKL